MVELNPGYRSWWWPPRDASDRTRPRPAESPRCDGQRNVGRLRFPKRAIDCAHGRAAVRSIFMRAPGAIQRYFVIESFMDELATAARADPLDFRLRYMRPGVNVDLLQVVRRSSGWATRPSPRSRTDADSRVVSGRGYGQGESAHMVVELDVDRDTGRVRINQVWVAYSPGLIVNPDGLINQLEQATLQGLSRSLIEEVKFNTSKITTVDWVSHPILKFSDVPKVHVDIVDRPDMPLNGAGEMGSMPTAGAIGNAIFDATGVRLRRASFTPARVLAALKSR